MKITFRIGAIILATTSLWAGKVTNKPIAVVNGETILLSEFQKNWDSFVEQQKDGAGGEGMTEAMKKDAGKKLFDQMIDDKVLQGEAKKRKIRVPQRDLENGIMQVKARFLSDEGKNELQTIVKRQLTLQGEKEDAAPDLAAAWKELVASHSSVAKEAEGRFQAELSKEGLDLKKFTDRIRDQLSVVQLTGQIVRERTSPPSDQDVKKLFDRVSDKIAGKEVTGLPEEDAKDLDSMAKYFGRMTGEQVHARHILLSSLDDKGQPVLWSKLSNDQKAAVRAQIETLRKEIKGGADFADLAEKKSVDKGSAAQGGDLGFFGRGQMVPAFENTAFSLAEGQVSGIVETPFGLHLIKVIEKKPASKLRLEQAENDLREYLYRSSQQKVFEDYVAGLRKGADIKVMMKPEELSTLLSL